MDTEQNQPTHTPNIDSSAEHLLDVVPRLMRLIASEAQASGISGALTVSQLRALGLLARGPRLPSELARELKITPATASEVADLLVRRGLVERGTMPEDRRLTLLRITPAGETLHQAARQRTLGALRRLLSRLDTSRLAALESGLAALLDLSQQKPSGNEHVG